MSKGDQGLVSLAARISRLQLGAAGVITAAVLAIVLLAVGFFGSANRIDTIARQHEEQLVTNGLKLKDAALRDCMSPETVWDDAVARLDRSFDPAWAATNIGDYFKHACGVNQVFVIDGSGRVRWAWRDGRVVAAVLPKDLVRTVDELVRAVRRGETARGRFPDRPPQSTMIARPIDRTSAAATPEGPVMVAASLVQPDFGHSLPSAPRAPIVVAVQPVDQAYLDWLSAHFLLQGLHLEVTPFTPLLGNETSAPLLDRAGRLVARLDWSYSKPVRALALVAAPSLGVLVLLLVGVPAMVILRERRQARLLAEAMAAAHAASEAKSRFIANMSHEIRTPMNGVLGVLHLLQGKSLDADSAHLIEEAMASGVLLQGLLNDVLDLSRIEEGRLELELLPMSPHAAAHEVAGLFDAQAREKGVALETGVEGDPAWVMADGLRVRQVLMNLVGNAVKFTAKGRVGVRLTLSPPLAGRRTMRFEVEDTGIGIAAPAQALMFQRFSQADGSTARRFGGSGLGLSISEALVELMGGRIGFDSREGAGSTFWFELEVEETEGPKEQSPEGGGEDGAADGLKILLVEDNATNRLVASRILEAIGAQVETATNGVEGLEAAKTGAYDLILMDVQMPVMDGVVATRRIRALAGAPGRTPIIGLTANVLPEQRGEYIEAGMQDVAGKPLNPAALIDQIDAVLRAAAGQADAEG